MIYSYFIQPPHKLLEDSIIKGGDIMTIGIIGTGNMGTILTTSLIEGVSSPPSDLYLTNRTITKAEALKETYPDINIEKSALDIVKKAEIIFICIKPLDIHSLLEEIKDELLPHQLLVSITSPIRVDQIESLVNCHVARVIPSITNRALSGSTLISFGESCGVEHRNHLISIVEKIGRPIYIDEPITRVASDISSCGPAFFSYLIQRFIEAAVEETGITKEQANELTREMIVGLGKLFEKEIYSVESLQEKVNVKGGITGMGLSILEEELGEVFNHLFQTTHEKFREDHVKVDAQFEE